MIEEFKRSMMVEFDMSGLGKMGYFLGVEVIQDEGHIFITQQKYAKDILDRYGMIDSKPVSNPVVAGNKMTKDEEGKLVSATLFKQVIGSLMYLNAT